MAQISKNIVDADLRARIFDDLLLLKDENESFAFTYMKVNDRQYGVLLTDKNGMERYCRVGVIVAEEREGMTARELMNKEIAEYQTKQAEKAEKAAKKAEKIAKNKAKREAKAQEGE